MSDGRGGTNVVSTTYAVVEVTLVGSPGGLDPTSTQPQFA